MPARRSLGINVRKVAFVLTLLIVGIASVLPGIWFSSHAALAAIDGTGDIVATKWAVPIDLERNGKIDPAVRQFLNFAVVSTVTPDVYLTNNAQVAVIRSHSAS